MKPLPQVVPGVAALLLAGGRSSRMGQDKQAMMLDGETLLTRQAQALGQLARPVLVSLAPGQEPAWGQAGPPLAPGRWLAVADPVAHQGPLAAMAAALPHLQAAGAVRVLVSAVDLPHLTADWLAQLLAALGQAPACCFSLHGVPHPLAAVYTLARLAQAPLLLAQGQQAPRGLLQDAHVLPLDPHLAPHPLWDWNYGGKALPR